MTVNRKTTGTASSIPAGLASGALVSIGMTLAGAFLTAKLLDSQILKWDNCGYGVLVILLISSWAGAVVTASKVKRKRLVMCLASGGIYFILLMISTALFFGGKYSGVGETGLLIFCGSMVGLFSGFPGKNRRKRRKIKVANR